MWHIDCSKRWAGSTGEAGSGDLSPHLTTFLSLASLLTPLSLICSCARGLHFAAHSVRSHWAFPAHPFISFSYFIFASFLEELLVKLQHAWLHLAIVEFFHILSLVFPNTHVRPSHFQLQMLVRRPILPQRWQQPTVQILWAHILAKPTRAF